MPTIVHFLDVGQGNMTLLELANGTIMLYDCNVTNDNEDEVLEYLGKIIGWGSQIDVFVNSHRDSDHMRGIKKVHEEFPINLIWDSGATGTTPDSKEYKDYMDLRRRVGYKTIKRRKIWEYGRTLLRVMNSKNDDLSNNANAQSIVIKVEHRDEYKEKELSSALLTGDTDAETWKDTIVDFYGNKISTDILLASHHGSDSFFDYPDDEYYYTSHIKKINPAVTIISVGNNNYGHPDKNAVELYKEYSTGSNKGSKIKRTDKDGNIKLVLKDDKGWSLNCNQ